VTPLLLPTHAGGLEAPTTQVRQVYVVTETLALIQSRHGDDLDLERAIAQLPSILYAPRLVYETAQKPNSVLLAGERNQKHDLVVCVKVMQRELWLTTMYKMRNVRVNTLVARVGAIYVGRE
jgi:hypothetical protein